jgi:hypothetical protein
MLTDSDTSLSIYLSTECFVESLCENKDCNEFHMHFTNKEVQKVFLDNNLGWDYCFCFDQSKCCKDREIECAGCMMPVSSDHFRLYLNDYYYTICNKFSCVVDLLINKKS